MVRNPTGKNGREQKPWADAIKRALARAEHDPKGSHRALNALAERLLDKCADGDMASLRELGDRLDGKAPQSTDLTINDRRSVADLTNAELAAIAAGGSARAVDAEDGASESPAVH